ncbi:DUF2871 domain-containing protein [Anaerococcus prevotii]|uniref:DUF2871 domain-containing protein n=1 Tax=Anaerococcus prevotii ACS-065-V-Col13 TaxID=879305 RepID=F0GUP6_9FIRM|nr:DUF2871 domain-containing protein [Anaerococcus prevotii]EGC82668.1 hypothetical protein HMPREF9290_1468 [Anaerococcus prevotii ACS-065-V-Col13]
MKKYINNSLVYAILAMVAGVFYREFTKYMRFVGDTMLLRVHPHLFVLGMAFFLILFLLSLNLDLTKSLKLEKHILFYNIGLLFTAIMMEVRGLIQVLNSEISSSMNSMISGIAGIGHIILGVSLILILLDIKKSANTIN